jgi:hypothetical protein
MCRGWIPVPWKVFELQEATVRTSWLIPKTTGYKTAKAFYSTDSHSPNIWEWTYWTEQAGSMSMWSPCSFRRSKPNRTSQELQVQHIRTILTANIHFIVHFVGVRKNMFIHLCLLLHYWHTCSSWTLPLLIASVMFAARPCGQKMRLWRRAVRQSAAVTSML